MGSLKQTLAFVVPYVLLLSFLAVTPSCGGGFSGSEIAPISIPAPVTGRLTISSPDDDGLVTVIGEESAVSANAVVLAVNTSVAEPTALKIWNSFFKELLAQVFPNRCSLAGRACGKADDTGAFEFQIAADEDDDIELLEIDATTGVDLSFRLKRRVPRGFIPFLHPPVDVAVDAANQYMYVLLDNGADLQASPRIVRFDLQTRERKSVDIVGETPRRLLLNPAGDTLVFMEVDEKLVGVMDVSGGQFDSSNITISDVSGFGTPTDLAFNASGTELWVSFNSPTMSMLLLNPQTLATINQLQNISLPGGLKYAGTFAVKVADIAAQDIGSLLIRGTDPNSNTFWLTAAYDNTFTLQENPQVVDGLIQPVDLAYVDETIPPLWLISDNESDSIFTYDPSGPTKTDVTAAVAQMLVGVRNIVVTEVGTDKLAFVTARNRTEGRLDTVLTVDLGSLEVIDITPVGLNPRRLTWDESSQRLFVVASGSRSVTILPLSALLPGNPDTL